jgi:type IV pilus assembly protein PilE
VLEFVQRNKQCLPFRKLQNGFSLLEIMLVVFIIGVLLLVALPTYQSYVAKGNRSDAMKILSEIMFEQERHQLRKRTYTTDLSHLGYGLVKGGVESDLGFYRVTAHPCSAQLTLRQCVELSAEPIPTRMPAWEKALSLNSRDQRKGEW